MTLNVPTGVPPQVDLLVATEDMYRQAAEDLYSARQALRAGRIEEVKAATQAVRDLKTAFEMVMQERARLEKLRKDTAGAVGDRAIDFDAARLEIGRRLARLRDAGDG
jgi:hypothetical protein